MFRKTEHNKNRRNQQGNPNGQIRIGQKINRLQTTNHTNLFIPNNFHKGIAIYNIAYPLWKIKYKKGYEIMSKTDGLPKVYSDIDTATEISHAILSELMESAEDERTQYIILGVLEQLESIKKSITLFGDTLKGGVAA